MDAANAAIAEYLAGRGCTVDLVGYRIDDELRTRESITFHRVARPLGAYFLGQELLARAGRNVARRALASSPGARVLVNGGNCDFPDLNWVHSVQHAWTSDRQDAPAWFRIKDEIAKRRAVAMERRALMSARIIIANSNRTRDDIMKLGVPATRVHTVYLGSEPRWKSINAQSRQAARARFSLDPDRPVAAFIGALGHDNRKGFDILWNAWQRLCARREWDADLIVAGGGRALEFWRSRVKQARLENRIRLIGHIDVVGDVLAAADLLVSPVRYEAYGLAVHEALCCRVPAIVSATAGVAERYPAAIRDWLIPDPEDVDDLVTRLGEWRKSRSAWKERVEPIARQLRARTWDDMAAEMVLIAMDSPPLANVAS